MQQNLFEANNKIIKSESKIRTEKEKRQDISEGYNKEYCFNQIKKELYLWDMRCWEKPRNQYTIDEVIKHIEKWLDNEGSCNCGHTLFCIRNLLKYNWATKREIAVAVLENNNIKFPDEIGTW